MASPTRTRARKTAQSKDKKAEITQEELDLASAQENAELQASQMAFLINRVGQLRIKLNRANKEIERLGGNPVS